MTPTALSLNRAIPAEFPVRDALSIYLSENGFTRGQYDDPFVMVNFWGIRFPVANPKGRKLAIRYHDLHHVMTGYGTDPIGEAELSAWELRRGICVFVWYIRLIIFGGTLVGLLLSPRRIWNAWKSGRSRKKLPQPSMTHYEGLLQLTLGELRARYGVDRNGLAGPRRLHRDAPKT